MQTFEECASHYGEVEEEDFIALDLTLAKACVADLIDAGISFEAQVFPDGIVEIMLMEPRR